MLKKIILTIAFIILTSSFIIADPPDWQPISPTQYNMIVMATIELAGGYPFEGIDDNMAGAFGPGGEEDCRAVAIWCEPNPPQWDEGFWYFTIVSNDNSGTEVISFKIYDTTTDTVYDCNETVIFEDNVTIGTPMDPFQLTCNYIYTLCAAFTANPTSGYWPLEVNFTDETNGNPTIWQWDFQNDGVIDSYEQNPVHTYYQQGTYSVKLIVQDYTQADTLIKENYITVNINPNPFIVVNPESLNFGNYVVNSTKTLPIWVHNYGGSTLNVSNIVSSTGIFSVSLPTKDVSFSVPSLDSQMVYVHFTPTDTVSYSGNLIFFSNDPVNSVLFTDVYGKGEEDSPASPTGVQVSIIGDDAVITWNPVDTTIYGSPVTVDYYLVLFGETPDSVFYFHGATQDTTYTHYYVAKFRDQMFYQVESFVGTKQELDRYIEKCLLRQNKIHK